MINNLTYSYFDYYFCRGNKAAANLRPVLRPGAEAVTVTLRDCRSALHLVV